MKKYAVLFICTVLLMVIATQIPGITESLAEPCATVPVKSGTANEIISCKGVIEKSGGAFIARIQICEDDISKIKPGQAVNVRCSALGDKILKGNISNLSDSAYQILYSSMKITVIDAIIEFKEKDENLKQGYSVWADIILSELENADIIPFEAVAQDKSGDYYIYHIVDGWAVKKYVNVAFEDEKGVVLSEKYGFKEICENPSDFSEDYVRIKNVGDD